MTEVMVFPASLEVISAAQVAQPTLIEIESLWESQFNEDQSHFTHTNGLQQAMLVNSGVQAFWSSWTPESIAKEVLRLLGGDILQQVEDLIKGPGNKNELKMKIAKLIQSVVNQTVGKVVPSFLVSSVAAIVIPVVVNALFALF